MRLLTIATAAWLSVSGFAAADDASGVISAGSYHSIQEAIDANPGRTIFVPSGDHVISERLRITTDNTSLCGPGRIFQSNPEQPIIVVEKASGVRLGQLTLTRSEGRMEARAEGVYALQCRDLVLQDLRILDNHSAASTISLRECAASQVRGCLVQNYTRVSVDDRTGNPELGYAFKCLDGTGIAVSYCKGMLIEGNRVIEQKLLPTPEIQKQFDLGTFVKRNAQKGVLTNQKMWDEQYMKAWHQGSAIVVTAPEISDCTQLLGNYIENAAQGLDIHADHVIVSNNIVNNAFIGMKAMHGSRNVLITGNQFIKNDLWSIGLMPGAASHVATAARDGKPAAGPNVDGGTIIANNIISDFGYGHAHWLWGTDGNPIRFDHGQRENGPPLSDVIIQGNIVYDTGRDQILVDGRLQIEPPRYKYTVRIEGGPSEPKGLHFSNNILHAGTEGVSNVELKP